MQSGTANVVVRGLEPCHVLEIACFTNREAKLVGDMCPLATVLQCALGSRVERRRRCQDGRGIVCGGRLKGTETLRRFAGGSGPVGRGDTRGPTDVVLKPFLSVSCVCAAGILALQHQTHLDAWRSDGKPRREGEIQDYEKHDWEREPEQGSQRKLCRGGVTNRVVRNVQEAWQVGIAGTCTPVSEESTVGLSRCVFTCFPEACIFSSSGTGWCG